MGSITIDGCNVDFKQGQTIMEAAEAAGIYIPHLCHHHGYQPHGSCKICTVMVNGRNCSACTFPAQDGQVIVNQREELARDRKKLVQMLFVEGNHFCPSCEKSGNCRLQAVGYELNMLDNHFPHIFPQRHVDASHPDVWLDRNRCIFCTLCVRASHEKDGKNVFGISGRGIGKRLVVNSTSGLLRDSELDVNDQAAHICPTGAILIKKTAYQLPIGKRIFDQQRLSETCLLEGKDEA